MTPSNRIPAGPPSRFIRPLAVGALVSLALPIRAAAQEPSVPREEWSAPFAVQSVGRPLDHALRRVVVLSEPAPAPAPAPEVEVAAPEAEAPKTEAPKTETSVAAKEPPRPAAATGTRTHRVEWGETWYGLAREYGVTPRALSAANPDVDPERLRSGEVIRIPRAAPTSARRTHRVVPGETLWGISRRYGVTAAALRRANRLPDDRVRSGQLLIIPQEEKR